MSDINWGDVPTWLSAATAFGALAAATWAGVTATKSLEATNASLELERGRDAHRDDQARRAQARRVCAVPGRAVTQLKDEQGWFNHEIPIVQVHNNSEVPIYTVVVEDPLPRHSHPGEPDRGCECGDPYGLPSAPPGVTDVLLGCEDIEGALVSEELRAAIRGERKADGDAHGLALDEWTVLGRPAISFTDSDGQRWRRGSDGSLSEVNE